MAQVQQEFSLRHPVHVIPQEDDEHEEQQPESVPRMPCSQPSASVAQTLSTFRRAAHASRSICSSVIKHEASRVNKRLLQVAERSNSGKRRRLSTPAVAESTDLPETQFDAITEEEQRSIWEQASRSKRMAVLLHNLEVTQRMLYKELVACADDFENRKPGN